MEKKNTMLLTVIAVATLLVAVVGATFAYFSLTVTDQSSAVSGTVTTGKIPTITATTENANLYLSVNSVEMSAAAQGTTYYAVKDALTRNQTTKNDLSILKIETAGGEETAKYNCTATITVATSGNMASLLQAEDAKLVLTNLNGSNGTEEIDLHDLIESSNSTTRTLNWTLTGDTSAELKASLSLANSAEEQDYLVEKTLNVTITPSSINCPIQQAGD